MSVMCVAASTTYLFALQHKADELIAKETKAPGKLCQVLKPD